MSKSFQNPEIKQEGTFLVLFTLAAVGLALWGGIGTPLYTFLLCLIFINVWLVRIYRQNQKLSDLSARIDAVLHGEETISFQDYSEGELSILQSELQKVTVRLREQKDRLQQDKIYLADSIADISHQIRTPLTSMNLLLSMLSQPELSEKQRIQHIHELSRLLDRIDRLITALLKISRLDAGVVQFEYKPVNLETLIRQAAEPLLIPMELREQSLVIHAEGYFMGDMLWSEEAVSNILKNCMEHTPQGGRITVTASENALYSEICIEDEGPGISQKDLPHIFERFYKGENSNTESFGIGLALARMIVATQQGNVKAANRPDGGVSFTIRFYKGAV